MFAWHTLHKLKLGVARELGRSLQTTNIIEHVDRHLAARASRVKRWVNSSQRQRRIVMALLETEPRLSKLGCAADLPKLQKALSDCVSKPNLQSTSNRLLPTKSGTLP